MQTRPYTDIENADRSDIGKIALMNLGAGTLAITDTLDDCLATANRIGAGVLDDDGRCIRPITAYDVDAHTDLRYLASGDLVAVLVGDAE